MRGLWLACVCVIVVAVGCSSGDDKWKKDRPKTVPVHGKVLLNGEPLAEAQVVFVPTTGTHGASGLSGKDGSFKLSTFPPEEGVVPGSYKVMVVKSIVPEIQTDEDHGKAEMAYAKLLVPQKYTDVNTSGLAVDVPEKGLTDLKLELSGTP